MLRGYGNTSTTATHAVSESRESGLSGQPPCTYSKLVFSRASSLWLLLGQLRGMTDGELSATSTLNSVSTYAARASSHGIFWIVQGEHGIHRQPESNPGGHSRIRCLSRMAIVMLAYSGDHLYLLAGWSVLEFPRVQAKCDCVAPHCLKK